MSDDLSLRVYKLCILYLRQPADTIQPNTPTDANGPVFPFVPPLTAAEQATYNRIVTLAKSLVEGITPAEWQAIEPDIAGLQTYQNLASPTLAQTVQAVKAQSRILRAIIKN